MAIREKNLDPNNDALKQVAVISINAGASLAGVIHGAVRVPFTGKLLSAHVYAATLTDADDSVRVDLQKNGVTMLGSTVDPVAANTTTSLAPTVTAFVAGDLLQVVMTTGSGDAMVGSVTLVFRPYLGAAERYAAKNAGISITP